MRIRNHADVAKAWATSAKPEGRAGNIFFDGDTIYSYGRHFPIAKLEKSYKTGETVALFTTRDYSVTTAKHKSEVRHALAKEKILTFEVAELEPGHLTTSRWDLQNVTAMLARASECDARALRARKHGDSHRIEALRWRAMAAGYALAFDSGGSTLLRLVKADAGRAA